MKMKRNIFINLEKNYFFICDENIREEHIIGKKIFEENKPLKYLTDDGLIMFPRLYAVLNLDVDRLLCPALTRPHLCLQRGRFVPILVSLLLPPHPVVEVLLLHHLVEKYVLKRISHYPPLIDKQLY